MYVYAQLHELVVMVNILGKLRADVSYCSILIQLSMQVNTERL